MSCHKENNKFNLFLYLVKTFKERNILHKTVVTFIKINFPVYREEEKFDGEISIAEIKD